MSQSTAEQRAHLFGESIVWNGQTNLGELACLADVIRKAEAAAREQGMLEEREACAKLAAGYGFENHGVSTIIAKAIRARSEGGAK